jgi:hypothetical protein
MAECVVDVHLASTRHRRVQMRRAEYGVGPASRSSAISGRAKETSWSSGTSRRRQPCGLGDLLGLPQVLVHEGDRHAALLDRCCDPLDRADADVAAREDRLIPIETDPVFGGHQHLAWSFLYRKINGRDLREHVRHARETSAISRATVSGWSSEAKWPQRSSLTVWTPGIARAFASRSLGRDQSWSP